jgi:hypothetical protein
MQSDLTLYYVKYINMHDQEFIIGYYNNLKKAKFDLHLNADIIKTELIKLAGDTYNSSQKLDDRLYIYQFSITNNSILVNNDLIGNSDLNNTFNDHNIVYTFNIQ